MEFTTLHVTYPLSSFRFLKTDKAKASDLTVIAGHHLENIHKPLSHVTGKTCLWRFATRQDSNQPAQLRRLASLKFSEVANCYTIKAANNKGADQTAWVRRLICAFVVRIWHETGFLMTWLT